MILRRATITDIKAVFDLSNDQVVRAASFNKQPITWEQHIEWFSNAIANPGMDFFVGIEDDDKFVGQVRFKLVDVDFYEISVSITSSFRGKGKGKELVMLGLEQFTAEHPYCQVLARVAEDNKPSNALFKACGFYESNDLSSGELGGRVLAYIYKK